jgi:hypothetical protein
MISTASSIVWPYWYPEPLFLRKGVVHLKMGGGDLTIANHSESQRPPHNPTRGGARMPNGRLCSTDSALRGPKSDRCRDYGVPECSAPASIFPHGPSRPPARPRTRTPRWMDVGRQADNPPRKSSARGDRRGTQHAIDEQTPSTSSLRNQTHCKHARRTTNRAANRQPDVPGIFGAVRLFLSNEALVRPSASGDFISPTETFLSFRAKQGS